MKSYQALPLLLLAVASCTDDDSRSIDPADGLQISFGLSATATGSRAADAVVTPAEVTLRSDSDNTGTDSVTAYVTVADMDHARRTSRGLPVSGIGDLGNFSIFSFYFSSATAVPLPFFANETATAKDGYWTTSTPYYWPTAAGSTLSFWATNGIGADGVSVSESSDSPGTMVIDYTVPQHAGDQHDLMLATTGRINTPGQRVPLRFSHLCAAVRFVTGNDMQPGTIKSITLSGIKNQGRYSSTWDYSTGNASFTVDVNKATDSGTASGTVIVPDYNTLMMIPQQLGDNARLTVLFHDGVTGQERTMTASLNGHNWKQGTTTTYHIGISPDFEIEFTQPVDIQDANYVICNSSVRVSGIPADKTWTLTVKASDGSAPSVQLTADINEFARKGFWTDKTMTNGTTINNDVSARGDNTVRGSGPGDFPLTVFLPENITDTDRTVTLTLSVDGAPARYAATQEITQLHPNWIGSTGWEQIDDNHTGVYGFHYTAKHVYVYNDGENLISVANRIIDQVKTLISQYNAGGYATVTRYFQVFSGYRNYVEIDYSKLNQLGANAQSASDGLLNTRQLFSLGGTAVSKNFETALLEMKRINDDNTTAYVPRRTTDPSDVPQWIDGTLIGESQMLTDVLKKNKYYLNTSTVGDLETTTALIRTEDIVWYVPASGQFASAPAWYGGAAMNPGDFWSSTAGTIGYAYTGSGASESRTARKQIRVARTR